MMHMIVSREADVAKTTIFWIPFSPLQDFLGAAQDHIDTSAQAAVAQPPPSNQTPPPSNQATPSLSMEEYFQSPRNPKDYDC